MYLKIDEFRAIDEARKILLTTEIYKQLSKDEQDVIEKADNAMLAVVKRHKSSNKKQAEYVAHKRIKDKDFARSSYKRKYFMVKVLRTEYKDLEWMVGEEFKAEKVDDTFFIKTKKIRVGFNKDDVEVRRF